MKVAAKRYVGNIIVKFYRSNGIRINFNCSLDATPIARVELLRYLSVFVFRVGRVVGPLVSFDSGVLQYSGQPVQSRPFLDVPFDAVVAV